MIRGRGIEMTQYPGQRTPSLMSLVKKIDNTVKEADVKDIEPEEVVDQWDAAVLAYDTEASSYLKIMAENPSFIPSGIELKGMRKKILRMQEIEALVQKRHAYETREYGAEGCKVKWGPMLTSGATVCDAIVKTATAVILGYVAFSAQIEQSSEDIPEEDPSEDFSYNITTAIVPESEDLAFDAILILPIVMIVVSIIFSKLKGCAYDSAIKSYENIGYLDEVLVKSTKKITQGYNRFEFLKQLGSFSKAKLTYKQVNKIRNLRKEYERTSSLGHKDPFAMAAKNIETVKKHEGVVDCVDIYKVHSLKQGYSSRHKRKKKRSGFCQCDMTNQKLSSKDIRLIDIQLEQITDNVEETSEQVGDIIEQNCTLTAGFALFEDRLNSAKILLKQILQKVESANTGSTPVGVKDKVFRTTVLLIIEAVSFASSFYDKYEEVIGDPTLAMKYVSLIVYLIGTVVDAGYNYLLIKQAKKADIQKEIERILGFEDYLREINSMLKIIQFHESYRKEQNAARKLVKYKKLFDYVGNIKPVIAGCIDMNVFQGQLASAPEGEAIRNQRCSQRDEKGWERIRRMRALEKLKIMSPKRKNGSSARFAKGPSSIVPVRKNRVRRDRFRKPIVNRDLVSNDRFRNDRFRNDRFRNDRFREDPVSKGLRSRAVIGPTRRIMISDFREVDPIGTAERMALAAQMSEEPRPSAEERARQSSECSGTELEYDYDRDERFDGALPPRPGVADTSIVRSSEIQSAVALETKRPNEDFEISRDESLEGALPSRRGLEVVIRDESLEGALPSRRGLEVVIRDESLEGALPSRRGLEVVIRDESLEGALPSRRWVADTSIVRSSEIQSALAVETKQNRGDSEIGSDEPEDSLPTGHEVKVVIRDEVADTSSVRDESSEGALPTGQEVKVLIRDESSEGALPPRLGVVDTSDSLFKSLIEEVVSEFQDASAVEEEQQHRTDSEIFNAD